MDDDSGFRVTGVNKGVREKTAFINHHGLYKFLRIPFGFENALVRLHRAIDVILSGAK